MNNSAPREMNWKELLQSVADTEKQGTRYAFLLGAGASISSGIKGAADLTKRWLEQVKENNIDEYKKIAERTGIKKVTLQHFIRKFIPPVFLILPMGIWR